MSETDTSKGMALMITLIFSSSLSVFMSTVIFIFYLLYSSFRKSFSSQLIISISILDIITWTLRIISSAYSLAHDFETFEDSAPAACQIFGFLFSFLNLMTFFLVLTIGISLFLDFFYAINLEKKKKTIFFLVFMVAFIIAFIDILIDGYGKVNHDVKCWINDYKIRLLTFYIVIWLVFLVDFILMAAIIYRLKKVAINTEVQTKLIWKFSLFPLFMLITWGPTSIRRLLNTNYYPFELFIYFITPLQGFFNAFAYGLINRDVKAKLFAFFICRWDQLKLSSSINNIEEEICDELNQSIH